MTTEHETAYRNAMAADDAYQAALIAHYGERDAGTWRYRTSDLPPDIRALGEAVVVANDVLRAFSRQRLMAREADEMNARADAYSDARTIYEMHPLPETLDAMRRAEAAS